MEQQLSKYIQGMPADLRDQLEYRRSLFLKEHANRKAEGGFVSADESVLSDALAALLLGKNVLLKGPTGSGKTKLAETLSYYLGQPMHSINCSIDLDSEALLGFKTIGIYEGNQRIEFVAGPVVKAMEAGHILYVDEINMARPETLPILNSVLDYRRRLTNPFTGDVVEAASSFGVIAAINEGYVGTMPMNEALKNRFIVIDVPYIQGTALFEVLREQSKLQDESLLKKFVLLSEDLITQVINGQVSEEVASVRALIDTCDLAVYLPPLRAIQRGITDKLEESREKAAVQNTAETLFE